MKRHKITYKSRIIPSDVKYDAKYFDSHFVDSFNAPLTIIISNRGLGKTFKYKRKNMVRCVLEHKKFIYLVDSKVQIEELAANNGEKFFNDIIQSYKNSDSKRSKKILELLSGKNSLTEENETIENDKVNYEIKRGVIMINGQHCGYIYALSDFATLKRNAFTEEYDRMLIDEFIPETQDIRTLRNPYKISSIIQSIFRRRKNVKVHMLANTVRKNDPILIRLKMDDLKQGELRELFIDGELFCVAYRIDPDSYPVVQDEEDDSFSGKLNIILGEQDLQNNEFKDEISDDLLIPDRRKKSKRLYTIFDDVGCLRIHKVVGENEYYAMHEYGTSENYNYCLDKRYVSNGIIYNSSLKDLLLTLYTNDDIKFSDYKAYSEFIRILKIKG